MKFLFLPTEMNFDVTGAAQPLHINNLFERVVAVPVVRLWLADQPALLAVIRANNDASTDKRAHSSSSMVMRIVGLATVLAPAIFRRLVGVAFLVRLIVFGEFG